MQRDVQHTEEVKSSSFGKLKDGRDVALFTLRNKNNATVVLTNFGAALVSIIVPDKNAVPGDVLLGYDDVRGYVNDNSYLGFIVGRYGNRIAKGQFSLSGKHYQLGLNDGENHLHGGRHGFNSKLWDVINADSASVRLRCVSPDGEQCYPGTVELDVTYSWNDSNQLVIDYRGTTDAPTILNPTSHGYFNLTGKPTKTILNHELQINADQFTPVDEGLITTGEVVAVEDTPLDFRTARRIGERIDQEFRQLQLAGGYDHNWALNDYGTSIRLAATVYEPESGRVMQVLTDQPGLQFYSGNFLNGTAIGKNGVAYQRRTGLCFEAQHFPDSPNKPQFPSVTLNPGETYRQTTIYQFSTN